MSALIDKGTEFNNSLPGLLSQFVSGVCTADHESKASYLNFLKEVFAMEDLTIAQKISILNQAQPQEVQVNLPAASVIDVSPAGMLETTVQFSMSTSAKRTSQVDAAASTEASASGKAGFGIFSAQASMKATASVKSSQSRSSDYTAKTDVTMKLGRQAVPETLNKVMDALSQSIADTMAVNQQLATAQASEGSTDA